MPPFECRNPECVCHLLDPFGGLPARHLDPVPVQHAIERDRIRMRSLGWILFLLWAFASALWIGWRLTHG